MRDISGCSATSWYFTDMETCEAIESSRRGLLTTNGLLWPTLNVLHLCVIFDKRFTLFSKLVTWLQNSDCSILFYASSNSIV